MNRDLLDGMSHQALHRTLKRQLLSRGREVALVVLVIGPFLFSVAAQADDWPQWLGPRRDGVWRESNIVDRFPADGPKVLWRRPVAGGYAGPAVAGGRVYVTDFQRAPNSEAPADPFSRGAVPGKERVWCLDEKTGNELWSHEYSCSYTVSYGAGPRATPVVDEGRVYTLGAEGHLKCFDAQNGEVIWSGHFPTQFHTKTPLWGFAAHPLIVGDLLVCLVGGEGSVAVAFDKKTGQEKWRALSAKEPGYAPPTLVRTSEQEQLIIWHPESINALNPQTGALLWSIPWKIQSALTVSTPRQTGDRLFFTTFYNGSTMLRLGEGQPGATVLWQTAKASEKDTTHLHSIMSTPTFEGATIYGICSYGQLRALRADDGHRLWSTFAATTGDKEERWANAFLVRHEGRYFLFNENGDLIIAHLSPDGYHEVSRAHLLDPTNTDVRSRLVLWSHPAFANRNCYARNDREIVCVSLAKE